MPPCDDATIVSALHEEAEIITDISRQQEVESDRFMLRMIPDAGVVARHANNDSVIYGEAKQAPTAYKEINYDVRPLVEGQMRGRTLAGSNGLFGVDINDMDENACHGQCLIDFSHGYRIRGTQDFKIDLSTPEKCVREFDRFGKPHILGYFEGLRRQFLRYGLDNFSDNLMNLSILRGEANASVRGANEFNVTTGGWEAPPLFRISIHFLVDYRRYIRQAMIGLGLGDPGENYLLTVELPHEDWVEAVKADQLAYNPTGTQYPIEYLTDSEGPMRGRKSSVYRGIKAVFNDNPVRGYFKQTAIVSGNPVYSFVRVYQWTNVPDETAGLVTRYNYAYDQDSIVVDGIRYDMVTLIPHIDPRSFKRWRLEKPLKVDGTPNDGVNYNVKVLDGAWIPCNDHNDKFRTVGRHEFRFGAKYPEISGWIAYRHGLRPGYTIAVTPRNYTGPAETPANPETYQTCAPDPCSQAGCAQCGEVPNSVTLQCEPEGTSPGGTLNLSPCGAVASSFLGSAYAIELEVTRTGDASAPASVNYATTAGTATAGVDYTTTTGTLNWAAGDNTPKTISIPVLATFAEAVPGTPDTLTLTISGPVGDTLGSCVAATISISDDS